MACVEFFTLLFVYSPVYMADYDLRDQNPDNFSPDKELKP